MTLREWLKFSGLTQAACADRLGVPRQTVQGWLSGRRTPTLFHALAIETLSDTLVKPREWLTDKERLMLRGLE